MYGEGNVGNKGDQWRCRGGIYGEHRGTESIYKTKLKVYPLILFVNKLFVVYPLTTQTP